MYVKDYIGKKSKDGDVGLELEVEAQVPLPIENLPKPWKGKEEGSLRGICCEYITQGALKVDELKRVKIKRLTDLLNDPAQKTDTESPRTSFHVHVNVLEFKPKEVWAASVLYWLLEDPLMDYCGEDRKGNMFCLRLKDAEAIIDNCIKDIKQDFPFITLVNDKIRYSGVNLNALPKFGTLEFRGMRGTTDPSVLDNWSTAVHHLVNRGKVYGSPSAVIDAALDSTQKVFAEAIHPCLGLNWYGYAFGLEENILRLSELAYATDWNEWQAQLEAHWAKSEIKPKFLVRGGEDEDDLDHAQRVLRRARRAAQVQPLNIPEWANIGGGGGNLFVEDVE